MRADRRQEWGKHRCADRARALRAGRRWLVVAVVAWAVALTGCPFGRKGGGTSGGSDSGNGESGGTPNLVGTWTGSWKDDGGSGALTVRIDDQSSGFFYDELFGEWNAEGGSGHAAFDGGLSQLYESESGLKVQFSLVYDAACGGADLALGSLLDADTIEGEFGGDCAQPNGEFSLRRGGASGGTGGFGGAAGFGMSGAGGSGGGLGGVGGSSGTGGSGGSGGTGAQTVCSDGAYPTEFDSCVQFMNCTGCSIEICSEGYPDGSCCTGYRTSSLQSFFACGGNCLGGQAPDCLSAADEALRACGCI